MLRESNGSAILLALIALAIAGIAITTLSSVNSAMIITSRRENQKAQIERLNLMIESVAANPETCAGSGTSALSGFTFVNPTSRAVGKDQFALLAGGPTSQEVRLPINLIRSGNVQIIKGVDAADANPSTLEELGSLTVNKFYIQNPRIIDPKSYKVELLTEVSIDDTSFAARRLGDLLLTFQSGSLSACILELTPQTMCEAMGCKYILNAPSQKCACGFPEMTCPQTPGQPMNYIAGVDSSSNPPQPICRSMKLSCLTKKGPGFVFSGIDQNGEPICEAVEGSVATPTPAPTATATPIATPAAGCFNQFEVYFGWTCPGAIDTFFMSCPAGQGSPQATYGTQARPASCGVPSPTTWVPGECRPCASATPSPTPAPTSTPQICVPDGDVVLISYGSCRGGAPPSGKPPGIDSQCCSGNAVRVCDSMADIFWTCAPTPTTCTVGQLRPDRRACCSTGGSTYSTFPKPPEPGRTEYIFCGCGNNPEWWMIMDASGNTIPNGC